MTTIKSLTSTGVLTIEATDDPESVIIRVDYGGPHNLAVPIKTAGLLAALNAVPKGRIETESLAVEKWRKLANDLGRESAANLLGTDAAEAKLAEADRIAHEADVALTGVYERLSTAEAKLSHANKRLMESEQARDADAESLAEVRAERDEALELLGQRAVELHKAHAERDALAKTVERVREALSRHPEPCAETEFTCGWKGAVVDLRAALDPQPALPTETGSVIIATFDCIDTIYTKPIRRLRNGGWSTLDEKQIFMDSDCIKEWKPAKVVEA